MKWKCYNKIKLAIYLTKEVYINIGRANKRASSQGKQTTPMHKCVWPSVQSPKYVGALTCL